MAYLVDKGVIRSDSGIPYAPRWFCDNRLAFQADDQGVGDIDYFSAHGCGQTKLFHRQLWGGLRFFLCDDRHNYPIVPKECDILPFGYRASCSASGMDYRFFLYTAADRLYAVVETGTLQGLSLKLEFYDDYRMIPAAGETDLRYKGLPRIWEPWRFEEQKLLTVFAEKETQTGVCFSCNREWNHRQMPRNGKHCLITTPLETGCRVAAALSFGVSAEAAAERGDAALAEEEAVYTAICRRYEEVAQRAPVLESPYSALNDFFALAPLYHESLKVPEIPGVIRAQSTHYWMWGWDSMTRGEAPLYWGDRNFVGDLLQCVQAHASPEEGAAHAYGRDMSVAGEAPPTAQGMYITLLHFYQAHGGDIRPFYPFAVRLLQSILATEVGNTGLCRGTSLYPDFRNLIGEDGNDISCFNNTVGYCAARSMAVMAGYMKDTETEKQAQAFARRLEAHFSLLYDESVGFFDSSIHSETFEKRGMYSNNAVKWENSYCSDLVRDVQKSSLDFYERELVSPAGLRPYPVWCGAYDADSNQLSCWWPVMTAFYTRLANRYDKPALLQQWVGWVEYWTKRLMCPEGISCYADTAEPPFDGWNCLPGIWHGYTIRGWYTAAIHSIVGVELDEGGLTVYPYSGEELKLRGLHFGDRVLNIVMHGAGPWVDRIEVDGISLRSTNKVPLDLLKEQTRVEVYRTSVQPSLTIRTAVGLALNNYTFDGRTISASLSGPGQGSLELTADGPVAVELNGFRRLHMPDEEGNIRIPVELPQGIPSIYFTATRSAE